MGPLLVGLTCEVDDNEHTSRGRTAAHRIPASPAQPPSERLHPGPHSGLGGAAPQLEHSTRFRPATCSPGDQSGNTLCRRTGSPARGATTSGAQGLSRPWGQEDWGGCSAGTLVLTASLLPAARAAAHRVAGCQCTQSSGQLPGWNPAPPTANCDLRRLTVPP